MRLTLRTMLAYLDDILGPEDRATIEDKIQTNEQATELMYRIRDVMRRLRLPAPEVLEDRENLDPNTVAEYLDNTLSHERVVDFEKVCLDSDSHLAEVAACHQILTLVLGEPAEVSVASRRRAYALLEPPQLPADAPAERDPAPTESHPASGLETPAPRHPREVPEYLRVKKSGHAWTKVFLAACLLLLGAVAITAVVGRLGRSPDMPPSTAEEQLASRETKTSTEATKAPAPQNRPARAAPGGAPDSSIPPKSASVDARTTEPPRLPAIPPAAEETPQPPPDAARAEPPRQTDSEDGAWPNGDATPAEPTPEKSADDLYVRLTRENGTSASPGSGPPAPVGRVLDHSQVLLEASGADGTWQLIPQDGVVRSDEDLLSIPPFRPLVVLDAGLEVQLVEAARVRFPRSTSSGSLPVVRLDYGRVVLRAPAKPIEFLLETETVRGRVVLPADGLMAIRAVRGLGGIADPEKNPTELVVHLITTEQPIVWAEAAAPDPTTIPARSLCAVRRDRVEPAPLAQVPDWVLFDTSTVEDQQAAEGIRQAILASDSPHDALEQLVMRNAEGNSWLALRCLGWLGDFRLMVATLDAPNVRTLWVETVVNHLREAVHRGPETAAQVRAALLDRYPETGGSLYHMLWAYDDDLLDKNEATQLINAMEHPQQAVRWLAFLNLHRVTGRTFFYRASDDAAARSRPVALWREHIEAEF